MDITPLLTHRPIKAEDLPLDRLATNSHLSEPEKVTAASHAFEALLLRQVLSEAQRPAFPSKYSNDSATNGIYRDMVVEQLANGMAKSNSLGLAKSLAAGLQHQTHSPGAGQAGAATGAAALSSAPAAKSVPAAEPKPRILRSPKDAAEHAGRAIPERTHAGGALVAGLAHAGAMAAAKVKDVSDSKPAPPTAVEATSDD